MTETERIRDQFARAWEGEAWHGPPVLEVLGAMTAAQAGARPIAGAHSIWEIVLHIKIAHEMVLDRLRGVPTTHSDEACWPRVEDRSNDAWAAVQGALVVTTRALLDEMSRVEDDSLDRPVVEGFSSTYVTLHGLIQHDLYHAGQIAILKKSFE